MKMGTSMLLTVERKLLYSNYHSKYQKVPYFLGSLALSYISLYITSCSFDLMMFCLVHKLCQHAILYTLIDISFFMYC